MSAQKQHWTHTCSATPPFHVPLHTTLRTPSPDARGPLVARPKRAGHYHRWRCKARLLQGAVRYVPLQDRAIRAACKSQGSERRHVRACSVPGRGPPTAGPWRPRCLTYHMSAWHTQHPRDRQSSASTTHHKHGAAQECPCVRRAPQGCARASRGMHAPQLALLMALAFFLPDTHLT